MTTIRIEGLDEVLAGLEKMGSVGKREARRAVYATAEEVRNDALKSISREQSIGRTYTKIGKNGRPKKHIASAPGDAPNTDDGELVRSIKLDTVPMQASAAVGTPLPKGAWLEFGTRYMEPRPWLIPALRGREAFLVDELEKALAKAIEASNV
jgi:HK97 gp10 family phage protein